MIERDAVMERDVVIVGGGLVGTTLSIALAQRGVSSTVLERSTETPELLRGELIMPAGVDVLAKLGLRERLRDACIETEGTTLHHPAFPSQSIQVDYAIAPPPLDHEGEWLPRGLCGWRRPLYDVLREAARTTDGVELRSGFEVAGIARLEDRRLEVVAKSGERVRARLVVAADGQSSLLRRSMGFEPFEDEQSTFVQGFVGRAPGYARRHVQVGACSVGAAFVFPFPDGHFRSTIEFPATLRSELRPRAGQTALERHLELVREALPEVWNELGGAGIDARTDLQMQPGHCVSHASVVEDGFALAGDAAGCLDPFTGFGMALGLRDAWLLAEVVASAPDFSARSLRVYERRRQVGRAARREATDVLSYLFLDKSEGFSEALAEKLGTRWQDREWILPLVAAQFAGYDPVVEPSVGLRWHFLGLV